VGTLKVGIVGLGVGEKHLISYESHSNTEVYKICDINPDKLENVGRRYPNLKRTGDPQEILSDPGIDIVSIASYDNFHYEQILVALKKGKHVYVEKPLCLFHREAVEIRKHLNLYPELRLSSNLVLRTCPRFVRLKDAILSGEMGDIYSISADYFWGRKYKLTNGWRKDMDYYSIILGAGIHMIDLLNWVTKLLPVEVKAYGNQIVTKNSNLKYNDFAAILLKYDTGLVVQVSAHGGCMHPHFHDLRVFGTKKTFMNGIAGGVWVNSSDPDVLPVDIAEEYPGKANRGDVIKTFIDSILNRNIQPLVSTDDIFNTMSVCFAAEKAINESCTIKINYI
jgi:predicted dehydrogenase